MQLTEESNDNNAKESQENFHGATYTPRLSPCRDWHSRSCRLSSSVGTTATAASAASTGDFLLPPNHRDGTHHSRDGSVSPVSE